MLWRGREGSQNVEDVRGMPVGGLAAGGGIVTLLVVLLFTFLGGDPSQVLEQMPEGDISRSRHSVNPAQEEAKQFVSVVLKDTEDVLV